MSAKMSPNELKSIFEKYAAKEGDPNQLSKEELRLLIQAEFPSLLKVRAPRMASDGGKGKEGERRGRERVWEAAEAEILIRAPPGAEHTAAKMRAPQGEPSTCALFRWRQATFQTARS